MSDSGNWEEITPYIRMGALFAKGIYKHIEEKVGHEPTETELFGAGLGVIGAIANATYGLILRGHGGRESADMCMQAILATIEQDLLERGIRAKIKITFEN